MRVLGSKYMKITIIGYKNHALRLKSILNKLGYDNVVNYNHHTDSLEDSDVYFISSPNETHMEWIDKLKEQDNKGTRLKLTWLNFDYYFNRKPSSSSVDAGAVMYKNNKLEIPRVKSSQPPTPWTKINRKS